MDNTIPSHERRRVYRTLASVLFCLKDKITTVDLRNESSITGKIVYVDALMNVIVEDATFVEYDGSFKYFTDCFIPCRMIRDVLIPKEISIIKAIALILNTRRSRDDQDQPPKKKRTFKMKRALLQQKETIRILKEQHENASTSKG